MFRDLRGHAHTGAACVDGGAAPSRVNDATAPQSFLRPEIHSWYNFVLGFSDQWVSKMLARLSVGSDHVVLDPFCGTGTTLVECMKHGIASVGIDANPFSCFTSRVKTSASANPDDLREALDLVELAYRRILARRPTFQNDATYQYLVTSGMVERGWICVKPMKKALALKKAICSEVADARRRNLLLLALASTLPTKIANMKFGPEIYCGRPKRDASVMAEFRGKVDQIIEDLNKIDESTHAEVRILKGDSRNCSAILKRAGLTQVDFAISSPPYPTEHDYTRNTRLELAFLGYIESNDCLKEIKKTMLRSHTKGVYKFDVDARLINGNEAIDKIIRTIRRKCASNTDGFARRYPIVVRQYFGGMKRHLYSLHKILAPGGRCAFIFGDQASYSGVKIPTAKIVAGIAEEIGYSVEEISVWRHRWTTARSRKIAENTLILRKRSQNNAPD